VAILDTNKQTNRDVLDDSANIVISIRLNCICIRF